MRPHRAARVTAIKVDTGIMAGGLDDIAQTLQREDRIAAYEAATAARFDTTALAS